MSVLTSEKQTLRILLLFIEFRRDMLIIFTGNGWFKPGYLFDGCIF